MGRYRLLHLYLHLAVGRVHVVKLLLAAGSEVGLLLCIKTFVQVEQRTLAAQEQPEGIEPCILVVALRVGRRKLVHERRLDEQQRPEVEVIAQRTQLVVDGRVER